MTLDEVVPGDGISLPHWPDRAVVLAIRPCDDGVQSRVFWRAPVGAEGVTTLTSRTLVTRYWDFRAQATRSVFDPGPVPVRDALDVMRQAQQDAGIGAGREAWS